MQEKIYALFSYAIVGTIIGLLPLLLTEKVTNKTEFFDALEKVKKGFLWKAICMTAGIAIAIKLILIAGFSPFSFVLFSAISICAVLNPKYRNGTGDPATNFISVLSGLAGLCVAATLPWWLRQYGLLLLSLSNILAFGVVTIFVARMLGNAKMLPNSESTSSFPIMWVIGYSVFASVLSFSTGIFADGNERLWHHWGAYVGPSELLLTGAAIFSDFPAQYGLGPTTVLASVCGDDCWRGMYFLAGFTTLAFSVIVFALVLGFTQNRWRIRITLALISLTACFIWTAFPASLTSPLQTPSVSGIRFLPAALLAAFLFFSNGIEKSKCRILITHVLWAFGALWSPESAFYVTFIWWPFYLFTKRGRGTAIQRLKNITIGALILISIAIGLVLAVCVGSYIIYQQSPTLYGVFAYAINPPGPLPIDRSGAVWFFLATVMAGVGALWTSWKASGDNQHFRRGFVVLLLSYAVFSYFLGRSHENNLLNIMPFMMLVLVFAMSTGGTIFVSTASTLMIASLLGWTTLFGWNGWSKNILEGKVLNFGSTALRDAMIFSGDAGRAVEFVRVRYGESATVLDAQMDVVRAVPSMPWSAIHGPANFVYIPSGQRQEFLVKTARFLKRPGWLVVDHELHAASWLADFDAAYDRSEQFDFGRYYAIRFKPKLAN